jgi:hypothetical protein
MRFLQNAVLAALKRVQLFLDQYAAVLATLIDLTAARKRLDDVSRFRRFADAQADSRKSGPMTPMTVYSESLRRICLPMCSSGEECASTGRRCRNAEW